jgi:hypothetical protein
MTRLPSHNPSSGIKGVKLVIRTDLSFAMLSPSSPILKPSTPVKFDYIQELEMTGHFNGEGGKGLAGFWLILASEACWDGLRGGVGSLEEGPLTGSMGDSVGSDDAITNDHSNPLWILTSIFSTIWTSNIDGLATPLSNLKFGAQQLTYSVHLQDELSIHMIPDSSESPAQDHSISVHLACPFPIAHWDCIDEAIDAIHLLREPPIDSVNLSISDEELEHPAIAAGIQESYSSVAVKVVLVEA